MMDHTWTAIAGIGLTAAIVAVIGWLAAIGRGLAARWRPALNVQPPAQWPSVTVIVPAWEERGTIEGCLESLRSADYPGWDLVVVAGGADGTLEAAREAARGLPRATVIEQPPGGKPAALNAGLAVATGEVIVLVDADSRVERGWLRALVGPIDRVIRATSGQPVPDRDTAVTQVEQLERISAYDVRRRTVLQGSGTIAIHRAALDELGGFASDSFADDWELDAQLALRGDARAFCRKARVVTERPATLGEFWTNEIRWRRAHLHSLRRVRAYFLGSPWVAITNAYPYLAAWVLAFLAGVSLIAVAAGAPDVAARAAVLWLIGFASVLAQRFGLVLEVAAFAGDRGPLRWIPAVLGLFLVTLVACLVATLSPGRATLRFKGPRSVRRGIPT